MQTNPPEQPDQAPRAEAALQAEPSRSQLQRRRFLRAGAGAVPVTLTLASRPVRAWHCNTSSAWGSQQVNPTASVASRNVQNSLVDETWTIYNWKTDTTRAGLAFPWSKVKNKYGYPSRLDAKNGFTVGTLFSGMAIPAGLVATDKVYAKLGSASVSDFNKYMMVARLNSMFIANVAACLRSNGVDQLPQMIDGSYLPQNLDGLTLPWNQTTIMQYLRDNWLVVPS